MGKGYEKKYKVTRISLADYLFVKQFSIGAGVSMSEALHQLIIRDKPKAEPVSPAQILAYEFVLAILARLWAYP